MIAEPHSDTTSQPPADNGITYVNGVFKGGGAKGIAYAGALQAMHERRIWFKSVAGASAGAITASLIAAGMTHEQVALAVPAGLAAIKSSTYIRLGKAALGHATSLFESTELRKWLDAQLATQIGQTDGTPVTFAELYAKTEMKIELYVVAMDLSNGLPVVFSRRTTPHVEVAGAVASSSAIPGGFPPGRGIFESADDGAVVHQLVDGGTWANYPSFIFQDRSFRAWVVSQSRSIAPWTAAEEHAWREENDRPVIGFILGDPEPLEHRQPVGLAPVIGPSVNRRFDQGPTYTSPKRGIYLFGAALSSDWARLIIGLALAVWIALSIAVLPIGARRVATWSSTWIPDWLYPFALVGTTAVMVLAGLVAIGTVSLLILGGRIIADTLIPSFFALMGVPTEVAPWIGMGDDSIVVRVPHEGLETMGFGVKADRRADAIEAARVSVHEQLGDPRITARLRALLTGAESTEDVATLTVTKPKPVDDPDRMSVLAITVSLVATAAIGTLSWWAVNSSATEGIIRVVLAVVIGVIAAAGAVWFAGGSAGEKAALRSQFGIRGPLARVEKTAWVVGGIGLVLVVVGAVLSDAAMSDRDADTVRAEVVSATDDLTANDYLLRYDDSGDESTVEVRSDRHLRLGEDVFVEVDGTSGRGELVGALDDTRFPVSIVAWIFGLGLITSGVRRNRWDTRCRRLAELVDDWSGRTTPS